VYPNPERKWRGRVGKNFLSNDLPQTSNKRFQQSSLRQQFLVNRKIIKMQINQIWNSPAAPPAPHSPIFFILTLNGRCLFSRPKPPAMSASPPRVRFLAVFFSFSSVPASGFNKSCLKDIFKIS